MARNRSRPPGPLGEWYLTRYDDVVQILGDHARFSSRLVDIRLYEQLRQRAADPVLTVFDASLVGMDPPDHARLCRLAGEAFTLRAVERLRAAAPESSDSGRSTGV